MSSNKKNFFKTIFTANAAACGCGRPKLSEVHEPTQKPKKPSNNLSQNPIINPCKNSSSSSSSSSSISLSDHKINKGKSSISGNEESNSSGSTTTTTVLSFNCIDSTASTQNSISDQADHHHHPKLASPSPSSKPKIIHSIAVEKESNDPFQDFRQSMLQMITEKEIYSKDDLQDLLQCFLELNSPSHHDVIVRAFMEIWNEIISSDSDFTGTTCSCSCKRSSTNLT